jgi:hypothetical protein
MANPTTNYGWPMPTSTDLVTDLPADFAAFGQPVDTSLKALNPETTLGDIAYRSATSNTNTRLGIGSTSQVLTVAAGVPSWATPASGSLTLLSTTTLTGTSTTISSISGAYKHLQLVVNGWVPVTNAKELKMRVNSDTGTNYAVSYVSEQFGTGATVSSSELQNYFGFAYQQRASSTGTTNNFVINLYDYTSTGSFFRLGSYYSQYIGSTTSSQFMTFGQMMYINNGTAITSITLFPETTSNQSGTAYLYGVN